MTDLSWTIVELKNLSHDCNHVQSECKSDYHTRVYPLSDIGLFEKECEHVNNRWSQHEKVAKQIQFHENSFDNNFTDTDNDKLMLYKILKPM
jgi:hypothetical protein